MLTKVRCLVYPNKKISDSGYIRCSDLFPNPRIAAEANVRDSPYEVLQQSLPNYFIHSYLGIKPFIVTVGGGRSYLTISPTKEKVESRGSLAEILEQGKFPKSRRPHPLTDEEKEELAKHILCSLEPQGRPLFLHPEKRQAPEVYAHVLQVLGKDITPKQVSEIFLAQSEHRHQENQKSRLREAQAWSELGSQVFGAEVVRQ